MPEQSTRLITLGLKQVAKRFRDMVQRKLAATKSAEDIHRDLADQERRLRREVAKLKRKR